MSVMPYRSALVLPADVEMLPVSDLPPHVLKPLNASESDFLVWRPRSRSLAQVLDANSATLLNEFRWPCTVVQAVIRYSGATGNRPEEVLEDAFPFLVRVYLAGFLVRANSATSRSVAPTLEADVEVGGYRVVRCIHLLDDSEVYEVLAPEGRRAALKLQPHGDALPADTLIREAQILGRLNGVSSPMLLDSGMYEASRYVLLEWCVGARLDEIATGPQLRRGPDWRAWIIALPSPVPPPSFPFLAPRLVPA